MSKLNKLEKRDRREMLDAVARAGGEIISLPLDRLTVVVQPAIVGARGGSRFVQVTVAVCSGSDQFRRKRGELIALRRAMYPACGLMVPVNGRAYSEIANSVADLIRGM